MVPTSCHLQSVVGRSKDPQRPVTACNVLVSVRSPSRAMSGTRPWVAFCDYDERQIQQDMPGVVHDLRRGGCRSAIAAGCQLHGPPKGITDLAPCRSWSGRGCLQGTCLKPASCNPVKLLRPSVYTVEPGSTFCFRKVIRVTLLKSGMTSMRARPVRRPRFS